MPSACIELQQAALHLTSPKFHCITGQSGLSGTVRFADTQRRHSTLGYKTPVDYDRTRPTAPAVAA